MPMKNERQYDVVIIGASLAGNCLARQLRLQHPELSIVVIERKAQYDYWVGESTIEPFYDYCIRTLNLGRYLESNHLLKHGLRFFFDSPEKDLPLDKMSELGRRWYLPIPSYQLDRKKFDQDLVDMNREMGIDVEMGTSVNEIEIDRDKGHRINTSEGIYRCRWLVDAAGSGSPLGRKLGNVQRGNTDHPIGAYWGRYEGCPDFDDIGDEQWKQKVHYTSRYLSTNHFMYKGYWIWVIPVSDKITSIGVSYHRDKAPLTLKNADEMTDFFREHKALDQIIGEATCLDFFGLTKPQRQADPIFSEDRWFMTGMSALFIDAMFSTTCSYIADINRLIGELIQADLDKDEARFSSRVKHYNLYSKVWYESVLKSVQGMYTGLYDVQVGFYVPSLYGYFGTSLPDSMSLLRGLTEVADSHSEDCSCSFESMRDGICKHGAVPRLLRHTAEFISFAEQHDPGLTNNRGQFFDSNPPPNILKNSLNPDQPRTEGENTKVQQFSYKFGMRHYLKRMAEMDGLMVSDDCLEKIVTEADGDLDITLNDAFEKLRKSVEAASTS